MAQTTPNPINKQDWRFRFKEINEAELRQHVDQMESMNSRQIGTAMLAALILETFTAIFLFFFATLSYLFTNTVVVAGLIGFTLLALEQKNLGEGLIHALKVHDTSTIHHFIGIVNPIEVLWNVGLNLLSIGLIVWDLTFPVMVFLVQLAFDILVPLMIFCIAQFGDYFMAALDLAVQLLQILVQCFVTMVGTLSGPSSGAAPSASFGGIAGLSAEELAGFSPFEVILRVALVLVRAFFQVFFRGSFLWMAAVGVAGLLIIDFLMNVVLKYIGIIIKTVLWLVQLFQPGQLMHLLIFAIAELIYGITSILAGQCSSIIGLTKSLCVVINTIISWVNNLTSSLGLGNLTGGMSCDTTIISTICPTSPVNILSGSAFGVGICDAAECVADVLAIIGEVATQMPACIDWVANSMSTTQCMSIVFAFSQVNSTSTASASIDSISKELCFVLTATVIAQCQSSMPPFSFSYQTVADNVCIIDKSGLSPPLPPFNDNCACVYAAPLCIPQCCEQYSLHVIGQVKSYIGNTQCGTILSQYPEGFWCQYQALNGSQVPGHTDLTFSSDWCAAYQLVIFPACSASSPTITLNMLDLSTLIPTYTETFCNSTVNQPGVCIRIDTTIDQGILTFQYEQSLLLVQGVLGTNNAVNALGFQGGNIVTTPQLGDNTEVVLQKDLQKYYCYYFALLFNSSNPTIEMRHKSVLATTSLYCDQSLAKAYAGFSFTDSIFHILRTPTGALTPVNLIGIPPNVLVFGSVVGVNTSLTVPANETNFGDASGAQCNYGTGLSPTELNDQQGCVAGMMGNTFNQTSNMGNTGAQADSSLQTNSQAMVPINHLSGLTPVNANSSTSQGQSTEQQQTAAAATQVPMNWQTTPSQQMQPETVTYRTTYVTGQTIITRSYLGRMPLSWEDDQCSPEDDPALASGAESSDESESEEEQRREYLHKTLNDMKDSAQSFSSKLEYAKKQVWEWWENIRQNMVHSDPYSAKDEQLFSVPRARRGQAKFMKILRTLDKEIEQTTAESRKGMRKPLSQTMVGTRKLLNVWNITGTQVADMINKMLDRIADTAQTNIVDEATLQQFFQEQALDDAQFLFKHTFQVYIPTLVNFLYNANFTGMGGNDYSFGSVIDVGGGVTVEGNGALFGSGAGNQTCLNTWDHPLRCCTPGATPFDCCNGLQPLCFPLLPTWLGTTETNEGNVQLYTCPGFTTFSGWWSNFFKFVFTAAENIITNLIPQTGFIRTLFNKVTFPNGEIPAGTGKCLLWWWFPFWVGVDVLILIFLFLSTQFLTEIMIILFTRMEVTTVVERIQMNHQRSLILHSQVNNVLRKTGLLKKYFQRKKKASTASSSSSAKERRPLKRKK